MTVIKDFFVNKLTWFFSALPSFRVVYVLEILIIAAIVYFVLRWARQSRAGALFKGIVAVLIFALVAYILQMNAILWILNNAFSVIVIALFIIFQPELRRALEKLGRSNYLSRILNIQSADDKLNRNVDHVCTEITTAVFEMAKVKTGALIVIEKEVLLREYERTGIMIDGAVSSQLLINIFEHNTPLHDGAVFIKGDRIVAATCYLPLSENLSISKELGTRHRAALGISEVSDSLTIVVSEETGKISIAKEGYLRRGIESDKLKGELLEFLKVEKSTINLRKIVKGTVENEKNADK